MSRHIILLHRPHNLRLESAITTQMPKDGSGSPQRIRIFHRGCASGTSTAATSPHSYHDERGLLFTISVAVKLMVRQSFASPGDHALTEPA